MIYRVVSGVLIGALLVGCGKQEPVVPTLTYEAKYEGSVTVKNPVPASLSETAVFIQVPVSDLDKAYLKFTSPESFTFERSDSGETKVKLDTGKMASGAKKSVSYSVQLDLDFYKTFDFGPWLQNSAFSFFPDLALKVDSDEPRLAAQLLEFIPEDEALIQQVTLDDQSPKTPEEYTPSYLQTLRLAAVHDLLLSQGISSTLVKGFICDSNGQCDTRQPAIVLTIENSGFYPKVEGVFVPVVWVNNHLELALYEDRIVTGMGVEIQH
ncbi:hypothetical protein [Endozoicomonas ascidiicola]|uniref:hypothetical protein n=1 Tax=Endozoicomonas ascidiicola TaxID=1698521 RepID=UPI00082B6B3A|nr:hypothetical protein [Endozoicomonas ascidiicola]